MRSAKLAGRIPKVSMTRFLARVGDLPMTPDLVAGAVAATAACGVDDVKLGIMPGGDPQRCFAVLHEARMRTGLILVFFADALPDVAPVEAARAAGAHGVMLDTAGKGCGALLDLSLIHISEPT